ncbi:SURF1 family protein [Hydrocarboniclastica marina]|uniref:SURF1 family protein n=1 Tax=Hydrocarboniclastica marina TaxID=2259620 RepID=UPI001FE2E81E|nr:SURF1 family protein [Hydrocarboniclastica marina]
MRPTITKPEVSIRNHHWQPDWRLWLVALVLFPLLIWLGFWQLGRAEEKIQLEKNWQELAPVQWPLSADAAEGQPILLEGHYMPGKQWLLDNRTRNGQAGYEILSLFQPTVGPVVVVNRGWIPGTRDRSVLPDIPVSGDRQRVESRRAPWPAPPILGGVEEPVGWPKRVQFLTHELALMHVDAPVSEHFLRLANSGQPGALRIDWEPPHSGVSTHYGYAVQWFGLAIALCVLTLVASFRRDREPDK